MADLWLPQHLRPATKTISVVFYVHGQTKRILVGAPEAWPAPKGFLKVVCRTAHEVDQMSQKMRDQEKRDEEMSDAEREAIEGPVRDYARKELLHLMANARNQMNRDFCKFALDKMDEEDKKRKSKRESWMHCEAAEDGK